MKKALFGLLILASLAPAEKKFFGLGLATGGDLDGLLGGLHGRMWVQEQNAVDIGASWANNMKSFNLLGEYKFFQYKDIQIQSGQLPWYWGVGGFVSVNGGLDGIGARVPAGLSWEPASIPFDFFGELAVTISTGSSVVNPDAKLGFHWYLM